MLDVIIALPTVLLQGVATWSALRNGTLGMVSALEQMQLRFPKMKEWIVCEEDRRSADQVATP